MTWWRCKGTRKGSRVAWTIPISGPCISLAIGFSGLRLGSQNSQLLWLGYHTLLKNGLEVMSVGFKFAPFELLAVTQKVVLPLG